MAKKMNYRCNNCEEGIANQDQLVAHYRREHPDDGWGLWDSIGQTGDKFSEGALEHLSAKFSRASTEWANDRVELKAKADAYDKLVPKFNRLARAVSIIDQALTLGNSES